MGKKSIAVILSGLVVSFTFGNISAGPVPGTGQTKWYNNSIEIACPQPGEAFYGQDANYSLSPPSYTKLDAGGNELADNSAEWVMVRDNITKLIWEVKTDDDSIHDRDNRYIWSEAQNYFIPELNFSSPYWQSFGGFNDWRLPTVKELAYIVFRGTQSSPTIDIRYFPNTVGTVAYNYWSSTSRANYSYEAFNVSFYNGRSGIDGKDQNRNYVRAVRGDTVTNQFVDNGNGTITDLSTGLIWENKTDDRGPGDRDNLYTWEQALAWIASINDSNYLGHDDWRLPNINELLSIVDFTVPTYPSISTVFFPKAMPDHYWSSTTNPLTIEYAWCITFELGLISSVPKSTYRYTRAVRGGYNGLPPPIAPKANAGYDQAVFDQVILDSSGSYDPDGTIDSYKWVLQHRVDSAYDKTAEGEKTTVQDLNPGFYDVTLTVTDNGGLTHADTMLLAVAGPYQGWPQPNGTLSITNFKIIQSKKTGATTTSISGSIALPELSLGDKVQSRVTIELFDALSGGGDCVLSEEVTLSVSDKPKNLVISK
jgi:hypothetical protein